MKNIFEEQAEHTVSCFCNNKLEYLGFAPPPHKESDTFWEFAKEIERHGWSVKNRLKSECSPYTIHCPKCKDYSP